MALHFLKCLAPFFLHVRLVGHHKKMNLKNKIQVWSLGSVKPFVTGALSSGLASLHTGPYFNKAHGLKLYPTQHAPSWSQNSMQKDDLQPHYKNPPSASCKVINTWFKPTKLCLTHDLNPLNFVGSLCKGKTMEPHNIHLAPHFEECSPGWKLVVSSFFGTWLIRLFWFELATRDTPIARGESHYQWTTHF